MTASDRRPRATRLARWLAMIPCVVALNAVVVACGSDQDATDLGLTGDAAAGQRIYSTSGCAACHGVRFQGVTGPALTGLVGKTVTFTDGTSAVVDATYLTEAIKRPQDRQTAGYTMKMPENQLSDAQIAQLVAFITALKG